ncbi:zinc ribbon domain-containing protein [Methanobacterium congolense]|uniref:Zinc-ribbon domain n=1 Tax=Methanobacterium congolense TaxID=118062 RepID=A0A1D3L1U1_9EURY|nr:zinc ribbon domain-containing protein [Methanobacterium congolense]SCG85525.1 zinc-ribbon domain [Methanobacterium congolense]
MTKICPNCGTENSDTAVFCQSCGEDMKKVATSTKTASNGGISGFWNNRGKGGKAAIGIGGICCIGLILIIILGGMFSSDQTTTTDTNSSSVSNSTSDSSASTTSTPTATTPTKVTISQLYNNKIKTGTYVQVTGTVLQSDGTSLRIENSDGQDIVVEGDSLNAYENKAVTVVGTYTGPNSYDTVMGSSRTVPFIENAKIVS